MLKSIRDTEENFESVWLSDFEDAELKFFNKIKNMCSHKQ